MSCKITAALPHGLPGTTAAAFSGLVAITTKGDALFSIDALQKSLLGRFQQIHLLVPSFLVYSFQVSESAIYNVSQLPSKLTILPISCIDANRG